MSEFIKIGNSGKTIVFLAGGNIDIRCYLPLLKLISKNNTVYAIDYLSINSKSIEETKSWIKDIILNLNQKDIVLIGHSFGADMIKSIELDCVSKYILMNSSIFKIKDSKLSIIFKVIINSLVGGFQYPNLFNHYLLANLYLILNLITRQVNTLNHIKQALLNVSDNQVITVKNNKNIIVASKNDYLFPLAQIPETILKDIQLVEGNHDWLIRDTDKSSQFILNLVGR